MLTPAASTLLARLLSYALLLGGGQSFDAGKGVSVIENLTAGAGPAYEARVSAADEGRLAVAWCVAAGEEAGVYLRRRTSFVWESTPLRVTGDAAVNPRDLSLTHDSTGAIHLVWTDMSGPRRKVFYAAYDSDLTPLREAGPLISGEDAEADYPQAAWGDGEGLLVVWQSASAGRYQIKSVLLDFASLAPAILSDPSAADRVAMSPQIVSMSPPTVGWQEILDDGAELRLAQLNESRAWKSWTPDGLAELLTGSTQPMVRLDSTGAPVLCWSEDSEEAASSIHVVRVQPASAVVIAQPDGDHRQPQLLLRGDGSASVAWQVFSGSGQSVQAVETAWNDEVPSNVRVSPPAHRFASDPSHDGTGGWSVIVWTDDLLDGGTGAVGFAEIHWAER